MDVISLSEPSDFVVSKLDHTPRNLPDFDDLFNSQYWIVTNYGDAVFNTNLRFTVNEDLTNSDENDSSMIKLFERERMADNDWIYTSSAETVNAIDDEAEFDNITVFKQFLLGRTQSDNSIISTYPADDEIQAYLNDDLQIQFTRIVYPGSGNLHIMNSSNGSLIETKNASSMNFDGST